MAAKQTLEAQNPLILRCNRLTEAFAKSDDERDFYLDRFEGFLIYVDLDKSEDELELLGNELNINKDRYCIIPKLTFYETKKIMEGFINEKVYDIDTKEKLLNIIQSKEARENFLEFIYDHLSELEKWQTFYQERSRIRIIEWLRTNHFHFVFEEDLDFPKTLLERLKKELFQVKVGKDILAARKILVAKSKTYYSNEALNPRPKRGRPPKQAQKAEIELQVTTDIYTTVPNKLLGFLFIPDLNSPSSATFSSKFGNEEDLYSNRRLPIVESEINMESLNQKLEALRTLSGKWKEGEETKKKSTKLSINDFDEDDDEDEDEEEYDEDREESTPTSRASGSQAKNSKKLVKSTTKAPLKPQPKAKIAKPAKPAIKTKLASKAVKKPIPKPKPVIKTATKPDKKKIAKVSPPKKQKPLRPIMKLRKKI